MSTTILKLERAAGIEPASSAWKAEVIATIRCPRAISGGGGRIRTCEALASDLQSDPFGHSGTPPEQIRSREPAKTLNWSWRTESNPRPADYKSAALPTELRQPTFASSARPVYYGFSFDVATPLQVLLSINSNFLPISASTD